MASFRLYRAFHVEIDGDQRRGGSFSEPVAITITTIKDIVRSIAATTTWDAWDAGAEEMADFDVLWIEAETDGIQIELTIDKGGEVGTEPFTLTLKKDVPFILADDAGFANYTADFGGGTLDVIDRIRIRNPTASAISVRLFMGT